MIIDIIYIGIIKHHCYFFIFLHIIQFKNGRRTLKPFCIIHIGISVGFQSIINEPPRGKTNNVVSEQVRHKPGCTSTEKSKKLEILDLSRRGIVLSE